MNPSFSSNDYIIQMIIQMIIDFYASQPIQARILSLSVSIISKYINLIFFSLYQKYFSVSQIILLN